MSQTVRVSCWMISSDASVRWWRESWTIFEMMTQKSNIEGANMGIIVISEFTWFFFISPGVDGHDSYMSDQQHTPNQVLLTPLCHLNSTYVAGWSPSPAPEPLLSDLHNWSAASFCVTSVWSTASNKYRKTHSTSTCSVYLRVLLSTCVCFCFFLKSW